jgi:hypothetical protein
MDDKDIHCTMTDCYRRTGCELWALLDMMREDEREHTTGPHPETYAKFRTVNTSNIQIFCMSRT